MNHFKTLAFLCLAGLSSAARRCDNTFPDGRVCGPQDFVELEDPASCYQFYLCDQGCVTHQTCPAGQKFDSLYSFCNSAQEVDCAGRPCEDPAHCPSSYTTTPGPDCLPPGQEVDCGQLGPGIFPDINNCRYYWHCSTTHSEPDHVLCPNDGQGNPMMFSQVWEGCDFLENTHCGERPICDECNQHCHDQVDDGLDCGHDLDCNHKPDGYYPDPFSCVKYWICQGGVSLHQQCPPDQYWEPVKRWCDWYDRVECGSRPPCNECEAGCP